MIKHLSAIAIFTFESAAKVLCFKRPTSEVNGSTQSRIDPRLYIKPLMTVITTI